MTPLEDVQKWLGSVQPDLATALVELPEAVGFRVVSSVKAAVAVPSFDCSSMDGYGVSSEDLASASEEQPITLQIAEASGAAGIVSSSSLGDGSCVKVMTGAPIPDGVDAIVKVEDVELSGDLVTFAKPVSQGNFIRSIGSNIDVGSELLAAGSEITSSSVASLAAAGCTPLEVYAKPTLGILSSGDELVDWDQEVKPGQIRDANRLSISTMLAPYCSRVIDFGIIKDDLDHLTKKLDEMSESCDVLVTTGAVSMGDFDIVKELSLQVETLQWFQVAMKPGKPLVAGTYNGKAFFGLPGNPVSARVSSQVFIKPILLRDQHNHVVPPSVHKAKLTHGLKSPSNGKVRFFQGECSIDEEGQVWVTPSEKTESHQTSSLAKRGGLIRVQPGVEIEAGELVDVIGMG